MKIHDTRKPCSSDSSTKTTNSSCVSGGGSSDCVNIDFSNQSINQIEFGDNEYGIFMFERTEDDIDEETNNKDRNTTQSENDLNKGVDNEDGVLSAEDTGNVEGTIVNEDRAEDTGNAEGTIVSEDREESSSETGGARRRVVRENSASTEEQREDPVISK